MSDAPITTNAPAPAESSTQEGTQEQNTNQQQAEPKPQKRFLKTKVNGKEVQVDEDTLLRDYSKYAAADQRFKETAEMRRSIEAFYEALENDPESLLSDPRLPINKQRLAQKWLREQIEAQLKEEEADPRDVKLSEYERELKKYKEAEERQKQEHEQREYQKVVDTRREAIATVFNKALEITPLSKNPEIQAEVLREMASYMRMCKQAGHEVSPEELASHIQKNRLNSYHTLANQLEGDELISWLGEAIVHKIRKADLTRLRAQREAPAPEVADEWQPADRKRKREIITPEELIRRARK